MKFVKYLLPVSETAVRVFAIVLVLGSIFGDMAGSNLRVDATTAVRSLDNSGLSSLYSPTQRVGERTRSAQSMPFFGPHLVAPTTSSPRCDVLHRSSLCAGIAPSLLKAGCLFRI